MSMSPAEAATQVIQILRKAGHEAWLAGGCVRDRLLGLDPKDYDVATSARPDEIERLFRRTIAAGKAFGVIIVLLGGQQIEVATFRSEGRYSDGRHPDRIAFTDASGDVRRRDFTVNGLLLDPVSGEVFDEVGGLADLEQRRIRTIGDADERFEEDGLRLLRAVRFGAYLDFHLDPDTLAAVRRHRERLAAVAPERIRQELSRIAGDARYRRGDALRLLVETGLAEPIFGFPWGVEEERLEDHARVVDDLKLRTLGLFLAVPARESRSPGAPPRSWRDAGTELARRLRCSSREAAEVSRLLEFRPRYRGLPRLSLCRRRLAATLEDRAVQEDLLQAEGDAAEVLEVLEDVRDRYGVTLPPPLLRGEDVLAMGLKPGPVLGWILRRCRVLQLDGILSDRSSALEWLAKRVGA